MKNQIVVRKVLESDLNDLSVVLNSIELFPSEMLPEMIRGYLENPETEDIWFTATKGAEAVAIGFCSPEKLTEGTFNLYAIGVKKELQGNGIGKKMMAFLENELQSKGHRVLIVETSGTADFELTRKFYDNLGYTKEAVLRDFWAEGDDKVIFWKKLN